MPLYLPGPKGIVAYNSFTGTSAGATTTELIALTCTATLSPNRQYLIHTTDLMGQSTVAGDFANLFLRQSAAAGAVSNASAQIAQAIMTMPTVSGLRDNKRLAVLLMGPAAGTYQFGVGFIRLSGTGTVTLVHATTRPLQLMVEDMGPVLASTSP